MAFYYDQSRCIACGTCVRVCKAESATKWRKLSNIEVGDAVASISSSCYHCARPACVSACPAGAISKREEDGIVVVDRGLCLGRDSCTACLDVCPYEAPKFGGGDNPTMQKCDLCLDRLDKGRKPRCVVACPQGALKFGPLEELVAEYGDVKEVIGFDYAEALGPAVVFKPKVL
ncbi:4Fe-4S dicluster domain-containing protein [Chloroflexota bacterium]